MADRATVDEGAPARPARTRSFDVPASGRTIDIALIFGLCVAFGLVGTALVLGGSVSSFYNLPSVLIVLIGTFAVTLVSFSISELFGAFGTVFQTMLPKRFDHKLAGERCLNLAAIARDNGVLALDHVLPAIDSEPFLQRAIAMTVDGATPHQIDQVMAQEIDAVQDLRHRHASVLRRAAEVAPSMGLIGTLIGLIQLLGNLNNPSSIGPAMAVALLTTFYGAIMAYMVLAPIAAKLERNAESELLECEIYHACAMSIARQENPRLLERLLNTKLPPSERLDYYG
ncbi:MotA/TolQ/ExbB proton channel family protein [Nisaea acidiphila]|uniref:MotA/TolQ/ExbB proton channel family protein n=1 Tax=Nisaea acidiphila TaxID=1862145 RepID=A0A9J7AUL5_9PROT|nr:MotA/TolQ/ExbB proton channel family protein [Nisaea acidiphila]UUX50514.1 MotA/TolQ/ExbB proton channel family protein [Nisaea acidiphila]